MSTIGTFFMSKLGWSTATACCVMTAFVLVTGIPLYGQAATGVITGTVTDTSGAVVAGAKVSITNTATNANRETLANGEGLYSAPALEAGDYQVRVEFQGFRTLVRNATVAAGATTTVDAALSPGETREVVTVEGATAQINFETNNIQGQIERSELEALPLNGRSFLQLASLEPGVTVTPGDAQHNALFTVSVLGAGIRTVVTMDGGNVSNNITVSGGESSMNFSQEMIQEFQLSSVNFDLATPIALGGAVNVVTRSGSNGLHGAGYFYFRDHNMAAYPNLKRLASNPNPFFARRNPGAWLSGPIQKNRLFFFLNYEYQNQVQALTVQTTSPSLLPLQGTYGSPFKGKQISLRLDYSLNAREALFFRYSHDGNFNDGQGSAPLGDPGTWSFSNNWADQYIIGLTSLITPELVNDLHLQYQYWSNHTEKAAPGACALPCVADATLPNVFTLIGSNFPGVGPGQNQPQSRNTRRFELVDALSWQKGTHRFKLGGDLNFTTHSGTWGFCNPMCVGAWSREQLAAAFPAVITAMNLPATFTRDTDVLQLPVYNNSISIFSGVGIGPDIQPGLYNYWRHKILNQYRIFFQDVWKIHPRLTFNYGLAWNAQTGFTNTDLPLPQYLAPIVGTNGLKAAPDSLSEFQPAVGFAWSPFKDNKTVIRGGGGLYWDSVPGYWRFREAALIGPPGGGRITLSSFAFTNTLPGITNYLTGQPLPIGAPIQIQQLYNISVAQFQDIVRTELPGIMAVISPANPQTKGSFPYSTLNYAKQGVEIFPPDFRVPRSYQTSIGVQHSFAHDIVLSVDWARRQGENLPLGEVDRNLWNRYQGTSTNVPVIPACKAGQVLDPATQCSAGPMTFWNDEGRSVYDGLLVKVHKGLSNRVQFIASYAFQKQLGQTAIYNELNWRSVYGENLAHHNLNVAGIVNLPRGFDLSVNSSIISRTPVLPLDPSLFIPGTAPNTSSSPLPELSHPTLSKSDLAKAVADFNSKYPGTAGANGGVIKALALPPDYQFGDPLFSQDFRLTKIFRYKERYRLNVFVEMFNSFNIANLSGYSASLDAKNANPAAQVYAFGQPTQRVVQTFGSGGPRAVQLGARFSF
jgi:Carboxypeptidase regulatory-like domain